MLKKYTGNMLIIVLVFASIPVHFYASQAMIEGDWTPEARKRALEKIMYNATIMHCDKQLLECALNNGVDPNLQQENNCKTPLMQVAHCHSGHYKECIIILLKRGANRYIQVLDPIASLEKNFERLVREYCPAPDLGYIVTFDTILQENHPELLEDPEIKQALAAYEKRRIEYSKTVISPLIFIAINTTGFIQNLANIVADYVVEVAPVKVTEVEEKEAVAAQNEAKKQKSAWCTIL